MDTHQLDLPDDLRASLEAAVEAIGKTRDGASYSLYGHYDPAYVSQR